MIVTVLGGNGFIGSRLVDRLLKLKHTVRIYDRNTSPSKFDASPVKPLIVNGDFSTETDFRPILEGCDIVFHLISTTLPNSSNANAMADVTGNLIPTLRLLDQMGEVKVKKIVFPSSGGTVYGEALQLPIKETHPTNPIVSYGVVKLAIEKYLTIYQRNSPLTPICLRISNPYGPGYKIKSPQGAIGAFLNKALQGQAIDLWGTGNVRRDYLYIDDLIDAMVLCMPYEGSSNVFNISTGIGTSLIEIIEKIQFFMGHPVRTHMHASRSFDVQDNILDNSLAKEILGWSPSVPLENGIEITAKWISQHTLNSSNNTVDTH